MSPLPPVSFRVLSMNRSQFDVWGKLVPSMRVNPRSRDRVKQGYESDHQCDFEAGSQWLRFTSHHCLRQAWTGAWPVSAGAWGNWSCNHFAKKNQRKLRSLTAETVLQLETVGTVLEHPC